MVTSDRNDHLDPERLDLLLHKYGIASEFIEFSGNVAHISLENRLHILSTMGITIDSADHLEALLRQQVLDGYATCLPSVVLIAEGHSTVSPAFEHGQLDRNIHWTLELEDGHVMEGDFVPDGLPLQESITVDAQIFDKRQLDLPPLPNGYHRLTIAMAAGHAEGDDSLDGSGSASTHTSLLIVAPPQIWQPDALQQGKRLWGFSVQLYSIKSARNWGMGDFGDLLQLVEHAAGCGAAFILLNPLHMLDLRYPENASPYSPVDRRYLNPLYIAIDQCEDANTPELQALLQAQSHQQEVERLQETEHVDYTGVHALKLLVLTRMYLHFIAQHIATNSARAAAFRDFVQDGGDNLRHFAAHQADLSCVGPEVLQEIDFHLYLQWLSHCQLQQCQERAVALGMQPGLVRDLAVGSSVDGCEVFAHPDLFCTAARIGAPPDNFNPDGQNWGLPPLKPQELMRSGFAHFIDVLRANMTSCGGLRIDHVMALMRLWWCPDDGSNASGAYVHYPVDIMFAILRLESCRNCCVIIGEDLGVVPPEIRVYMEEGCIYSNCVFYFEKYDGWHFRKPEHYKSQALAMIANHDVPTLIAWWNASDLQLRRRIGLIGSDDKLGAERESRRGEKGQLLQWLDEQGLLPALWHDRDLERPMDTVLTLAIMRACSRVAAKMLSLQLDDLARLETPVNIPGTSFEYPNWRRKIPIALEDIFTNTVSQDILQAIREARTA